MKRFRCIISAIMLFTTLIYLFSRSKYAKITPTCLSKESSGKAAKKARTVIIVSQVRFGSTFLGEFFNKRTDVSYFYEPIWRFPSEHMQDAVKVIKDLSNCRFDRLSSVYEKVFNSNMFSTNTLAT